MPFCDKTVHDFIHGDLHPGNILVSGTYPNLKFQVLDCGLALEMGPKQHENIVKVLGAFTRKDGRAAGQTMVDMKSESQASPQGRELFIKGIEQIIIDDGDQSFIENVGDYITDICSLACIHRVKLEGAFVNAALAVEIMEGLASALDPVLKVQQVALPLVLKAEMMVSLVEVGRSTQILFDQFFLTCMFFHPCSIALGCAKLTTNTTLVGFCTPRIEKPQITF